jgi:hypothetical protein
MKLHTAKTFFRILVIKMAKIYPPTFTKAIHYILSRPILSWQYHQTLKCYNDWVGDHSSVTSRPVDFSQTKMSTVVISVGKGRPVGKADNLTAICEQIF